MMMNTAHGFTFPFNTFRLKRVPSWPRWETDPRAGVMEMISALSMSPEART